MRWEHGASLGFSPTSPAAGRLRGFRPSSSQGLMFWFTRNMLPGSYFRFTSTKRS
jgi:hypothetical protein